MPTHTLPFIEHSMYSSNEENPTEILKKNKNEHGVKAAHSTALIIIIFMTQQIEHNFIRIIAFAKSFSMR